MRRGRQNRSYLPNPIDHVRKGDFAVRDDSAADGHSHAKCMQKMSTCSCIQL